MEIDLLAYGFWVAVLQIIAIDILLGGDNAVVIALACRQLPEKQRKIGIFYGVAGAIVLRVILIFFALQLLAITWLKVIGGILLLWIGIKLILPEHNQHKNVNATTSIYGAVRTIIIADAVMSLDNVVAVAAASKGNLYLVVFGILVSIPIIVYGSQLVIKLMDRFPIVIIAGGALLGWIGGSMIATDPAIVTEVKYYIPYSEYVVSAVGAVLVVLIGKIFTKFSKSKK